MKRIKSVGVFQTALVMSAVYFAIGLFIALIGAFIPRFPKGPILLVAPVIYGVFGFIAVLIICWLYNRAAQLFGGIEIELE